MDIKDIDSLTPEQILSPEVSVYVLEEGEKIIKGLVGYDAYILSKMLLRTVVRFDDQPNGEMPSALEMQYQKLVAVLKVVAVSHVSDEQTIDVMRTSLAESLHLDDFDLDTYKHLLKRKLISFPLPNRDAFREKLRRALHENKERLTQKYLVIGDKEVLGTVGNWLSDYIKFVGGGEVSNLRQAEYIGNCKLDTADRRLVQRLIQIYEYLKISSITPQGIEDAVSGFDYKRGKHYLINDQGLAEEIEGIPPPPWAIEEINKTASVSSVPVKPSPAVFVSEQKPKIVSAPKQAVKTTTPSPLEQKTENRKQKTEVVQSVRPLISNPRPPILIPSPEVLHENHPLRVELEELVDGVIENVKVELLPQAQHEAQLFGGDAVLQKRFRVIVSARLRGVRDGMETRDMLLRPVKIGGMGLGGELGIRNQELGVVGLDLVIGVMEIIEKAFGEFEKKWKAIEEQRVEEWKKVQRVEKEKRERQETEKEQKDLEERYVRLVGVKAKPQKVATEKKEDPRKIVIDKKIPPPPTIQKTEDRKQKTEVVLPVRPPSSVLRPPSKITDVRTVPRLVGHIEELSGLTLQDFKRLATNAQEATAKILSKIEFLSKESFGQRTQALAAWRKSPLNQFYTMISEQAMLKRVPPQTLLTELSKQGKPTITVEEFYAIMELNQKLRF